jgi:acid phosphatase type 7
LPLEEPSHAADPGASTVGGDAEFVIGTGGDDFHAFAISKPLTETREDDTFGVLTLTLHSTGSDWRFLPVVGRSFADSGSTSCH